MCFHTAYWEKGTTATTCVRPDLEEPRALPATWFLPDLRPSSGQYIVEWQTSGCSWSLERSVRGSRQRREYVVRAFTVIAFPAPELGRLRGDGLSAT